MRKNLMALVGMALGISLLCFPAVLCGQAAILTWFAKACLSGLPLIP
jgi:hypothetical protein